jgi:trehalose 6-phosphate synthase/phosphatase
VKRILYQNPDAEFVFCAGDDKTDEDMFRALQFPHPASSSAGGNGNGNKDGTLVMEAPVAVKLAQKDAPPVELALKTDNIFSTAVGHSSKRTLAAWHVTTPAEVVESMLRLVRGKEGEPAPAA